MAAKSKATTKRKTTAKRKTNTAKRKTAPKKTAAKKAVRQTTKAAKTTARSATRSATQTAKTTQAQTQKSFQVMQDAMKTMMPPALASTSHFDEFLKTQSQTKTMENMMNKSKIQMDKFTQQATNYGREQMEALIESGSILAKGYEQLLQASMSMAQDRTEKGAQFMKEAMSCKTFTELAEIHNKYTQANFDDFMSGATKISEMSVKLLTDCTEPLNEQFTKGVQQASQAMAA